MKVFNRFTIDLSPPMVLAVGFLSLIIIGTLLLKLPFVSHHSISWMDAWFTASSAVTITGLSAIDIGSSFNLAGQLIVAILIQLGGLGFMTFAVVAALGLRSKMGLGHQLLAQEALGQTSLARVGQVARAVVIYSLFFELIGFVLLTLAWQGQFGWGQSAYLAFFHCISAFNNAGFALFPDSLMSFAHHTAINFIISGLFIIGGIGFVVLMDVRQHRKWNLLSPNTRIVLIATLIINVVAFLLVWLLEARNPATLAQLSTSDQMLTAWFQATVPRSSGFNTLPIHELNDATTVLMLLLMFIGGGSLSTAGGIKLGTFVVLLFSTYTFLRRQEEVRILKRSISQQTVMKALALTVITMMIIFMGIFLLAALEHKKSFIDIAFEVVSAVCTVGLSRGITPELGDVSKFLLTCMMYTGRLGPLTLAYFIAVPTKSQLRYPVTNIPVG
nr:TrkH family potassium uptake protein [Alkanindiges illinoisensis]